MNLFKAKTGLVSLGILAVVTSACAPKSAVAPKQLFSYGPALKVFPAQNLNFRDNTFFLWRETTDVAAVLQLSHTLDDLKLVNFDIEAAKAALRPKFAEHSLDPDDLFINIGDAKSAVDVAEKNIQRDQKTLDAELAKAPEQQDQKKVDRLKTQIAANTKKKTEAQAEVDKDIAAIHGAGLDDQWAQWNDLAGKKDANSAKVTDIASQLSGLVDVYEKSPTEIHLTVLRSGKLAIQMKEWALDNAGNTQDFSTDDGTITDVSYDALGGIWQFHVKAPGSLDYIKFKLSRKETKDDDNGSVSFQGDLTRVTVDPKTQAELETLGTAMILGQAE